MQLDQATWDEHLRQEVATLQHLLGNQLTLAAGRAQLLSLAPELPPALRPAVSEIADDVLAAGRTLQQLQQLASRAGLVGPSTGATSDRAFAAPAPQSRHGAQDYQPSPFNPPSPVL
jgi:hypothetical protein